MVSARERGLICLREEREGSNGVALAAHDPPAFEDNLVCATPLGSARRSAWSTSECARSNFLAKRGYSRELREDFSPALVRDFPAQRFPQASLASIKVVDIQQWAEPIGTGHFSGR
jgi:hypothetical protein